MAAWQSLLDDRNKRQQQQFASSAPRSFFDTASNDQPDSGGDSNDGGFFGHLFHPVRQAIDDVGGAASAVGGFFGGIAKDFAQTTREGVGTVSDIIQSPIKEHRASQLSGEALARTQAWSEKTKDWTPADFEAHKQESQDYFNETKKLSAKAQAISAGDNIRTRDAKKSAAATAETFINAATLGGAGLVENLAKGGVKEIATTAAESGLKSALKTGAKVALKGSEDAIAEKAAAKAAEVGGKAALGTVARNTAEGALYGSSYGALDTVKKKGNDATGDDIAHSALLGGILGGAGGAAGSLLDKNVRNEVGQVPDRIRNSDLALNQGGYVKNPFVREGEAVASTEPAWAPEKIMAAAADEDPSSNLIQQVAAEYKSPEDFLEETARAAKSYDDGAKGGVLQHIADDTYSGTYKRTSDHTGFYRDYYADYGRKPSYAATKDAVQSALEGSGKHDMVSPEEGQIYQILKERQAAQDAMLNDPEAAARAGAFEQGGQAPLDQATEFQQLLTGKSGTGTLDRSRMPAGLPKGPQGTAPLAGLEPEAGTLQPRYDDPAALQAALGRGEAQTNPLIDYIDPRARAAAPDRVQSQLPVEPPANPYADAPQNLDTLALPQGELPAAPTPAQAKRIVTNGGDAPAEVLNTQRSGTKPIALPANVEDMRDVATKTTQGGKLVPVATNNAHPTKGYVDAIRAIAQDDTGSRFTNTRTPELNLEEATAKRGGTASPEFKELNQNNIDLREASARQSDYVQAQKKAAGAFVKESGWTTKIDESPLTRDFMESTEKATDKKTLDAFREAFGDKAAEAAVKLRDTWRTNNSALRSEANSVIEKYAGADRTIGDLGEGYVPRVYKKGFKGFKESVLDVAHSGLAKIGGKDGLLNLENPTGYLSKESESAGTGLRSVNQAPLNSDLSKPNTQFLSAAQKRTAEDPQGQLEGVLSSMMRYYDAVSRAKELTPVIAKGRSQQKVIELVNGETGNLRQMYDSLNDQLNSISGKTSSFDQKFVNTKTGNNFVRVASKIQSRISRSTIVGSANSALAQTGQLPLIFAENGPKNFAQGMADTFKYLRGKASPIEESALMRTRYPADENAFVIGKAARAGQKATDVISKPFHVIEEASSKLAWYSSYARATAEGLSGSEAVQQADRMTAKIIGERSAGARAALYESKALGPVTSYTLEVNQMYQIAKQYFKRDPKKAAALVGAIFVYNHMYKAATGNTLNADPLQATLDAKDILTNQDITDSDGNPIGLGERLARATGRIAGEGIDATPLGGQVVGQLYPTQGFRIPFGGGDRMLSKSDVFGNTNVGRYGAAPPIAAGFSNPLLMLGIPGLGQLQRSVEGNRAFEQGGVFDKAGDSKFTVDNTDESERWRALLLGIYGTKEGRAYLESQQARLAGKSTQ